MDSEIQVADEEAEEPQANSENWLVSYADLMTLLFGFFAMLYLTGGRLSPAAAPAPHSVVSTAPQVPRARAAPEDVQAPEQSGERPGSDGGNRGLLRQIFLPAQLLSALLLALLGYLLVFLLGFRPVKPVPIEELRLIPPGEALPAASPRGAGPMEAQEILELELELAEQEHHPVEERWLISYADMMTLLFGFFAMLYLMGSDFNAVRRSMEKAFSKSTEASERPIDLSPPSFPGMSISVPEAPPTDKTPQAQPGLPGSPAPGTADAPEPPATAPSATAPVFRPAKSLQEMEEEQMQALKERLAGKLAAGEDIVRRRANRRGGKGFGGGKGDSIGSGNSDAYGSTICSEEAQARFSLRCGGIGFIGCVPEEKLVETGGMNGDGGALEMYCVSGLTRLCLTWERCPWRNTPEKASDYPDGLQATNGSPELMRCSPFGLPFSEKSRPEIFARCRSSADCGFKSILCDPDGVPTVY